jgi:hypothetical protein
LVPFLDHPLFLQLIAKELFTILCALETSLMNRRNG